MELNKNLLDCMQTLRRRLRKELGVDIHLDNPDAIQLMLETSHLSSSEEVHALCQQLRTLTQDPTLTQGPEDSRQRYRGQLLASAPRSLEQPLAAPITTATAEEVAKPVRMYRGQPVYD